MLGLSTVLGMCCVEAKEGRDGVEEGNGVQGDEAAISSRSKARSEHGCVPVREDEGPRGSGSEVEEAAGEEGLMLKPDEYVPEQQTFTRPPGASVRRVGGEWVVRERIPSLKPAQGPRRADIGRRIDASMPLTIQGGLACDAETLLRRTYGPAACNDRRGNL